MRSLRGRSQWLRRGRGIKSEGRREPHGIYMHAWCDGHLKAREEALEDGKLYNIERMWREMHARPA